jgi:deoxycytidylate deaminase
MDLADRIAKESKCLRLNVGAVIVRDKNIIAYGWNGKISGAPNKCECEPKDEVWKDTKYENYQVSTEGKIRRKACTVRREFLNRKGVTRVQITELPEQLLNGGVDRKGYVEVNIQGKKLKLHRLIAETFIENPDIEYYNQINHIDGNKQNNAPENLEWCTNRYNCEHRSLNSTTKNRSLPLGVYFYPDRKNVPYNAQVYFNGRKHTLRCASLDEAQEFLNRFKDSKDYKTFRFDKASISITDPEVVHAEANAIFKAARSTESTEGATIFCTHSCCVECAKMIIQSGIKEFIYKTQYRDDTGLRLLHRAGIEVRQIEE